MIQNRKCIQINTITLETYIGPKSFICIGRLSDHRIHTNLFVGRYSFYEFWVFPGVRIKWNKYTEFTQGAVNTYGNGSIHCKLIFLWRLLKIVEKYNDRLNI